MKVKCPECGYEDEGNFCSQCGALLPQIHDSKNEYNNNLKTVNQNASDPENNNISYENAEWTEKCPICKKGKLWHIKQKGFLGLSSTNALKCMNCQAIFLEINNSSGKKYKLTECKDSANDLWRKYKNKIFWPDEWKTIAYGGLTNKEQRKKDFERWLNQLKEGNVKVDIKTTDPPVILKKEEKAYIVLPNMSLMESRSVRTGGYAGPSFRVAKGVSFRLGKFSSSSHEELKTIDQGTFSLTNKRIVFSGSKRSININLNKIISMNPYKDGFSLSREGKQKTQYFIGIPQTEITFAVNNRTYNESFSGLVLMYLIEGLAKQSV